MGYAKILVVNLLVLNSGYALERRGQKTARLSDETLIFSMPCTDHRKIKFCSFILCSSFVIRYLCLWKFLNPVRVIQYFGVDCD